MVIVSRSRRVECSEHRLEFHLRDEQGGFAFLCDEQGELLPCMTPEARVNYQWCLDGTYDVVPQGVQVREWSYREPAVGRCCCGGLVDLDGFTNTCVCGRDYDSGGSLLVSRECWGEETGEHPADIARIR